MADLAAVALGGDCLADIAVLREQPWRQTIRDFLAHWGQTRRTGTVNALIRSDLAGKGLTTRPPRTEGRVKDEIEIIPVDTTSWNLETLPGGRVKTRRTLLSRHPRQ